jgi:HK97 family phage major capsid protein
MKKKYQARLREVLERVKSLQSLEERSAEQTTELDALLTEGETLNRQIADEEASETRAAALIAQTRLPANPLPAPGGDNLPARRAIAIPATARRTTRHFKSPEQAFAFGQFVRASVFRNESAAQWLSEHGYALTRAGQIEGDNSAGGYLVPTEFGEIIDALVAQHGMFRQYATTSAMSRDTKNHPKRPMLLRMRPGAELRTMVTDTMSFGNIELTAKKAYLMLQLSSELSEDAAVSVADELAMVIADSAAYTEDDCGFNGTAISDYFGITGIFPKLLGIAGNKSVITTGAGVDTYAEITRQNLLDVKAALPSAAAVNGDAAWYCSNAALTNVFERLALEAGGATAAEVIAGATPRFLGYPIRVCNAIADTEASGAKALAFGSIRKGVVFGDRRELTIVSSTEAGFTTDSTMVRATERFDINVHEPGSATAAGALIVLKFA